MSRIFEALQRADRDKQTDSRSAEKKIVDPNVVADSGEELPDDSQIVVENINKHQWAPLFESFPTLADRGAGVEQFRSLRSRIYQARYEAPLKIVLVSSGSPSEGKSFITANLAMSLVRNSANNILLIDGDLRRPTLHKLLGAPNTPGLAEYLDGTAELQDILQRDGRSKSQSPGVGANVSNLTFIPAGTCGDNSAELIANHRIEDLIAAVSSHFDWILIDSPPVLAVTDAVELAHTADAVLLVARGGSTTYAIAQNAQAAFSHSRILGFVLNDVKDAPSGGYGHYSYYGQRATGTH